MIRVATLADLSLIKDMAMKFLEVSDYKEYGDEETIEALIIDILSGDQTKGIIIINPEGAMLVGVAHKFPFGKGFLSTEIAWWVNPELRKTGVGQELMGAFEYWAKEKANCIGVVMGALDDSLGKFYEKNGYKLYERAYLKVF